MRRLVISLELRAHLSFLACLVLLATRVFTLVRERRAGWALPSRRFSTPSVDLILSETRLEDFVRDADVVITGEGRLDGQTVMGKAPIGVAKLAKKYDKRVLAFSGILGDGVEAVNAAGIDAYFPILRRLVTVEEALDVQNASANLASTVEQVFRLLSF